VELGAGHGVSGISGVAHDRDPVDSTQIGRLVPDEQHVRDVVAVAEVGA
jgi:hypothetical protein